MIIRRLFFIHIRNQFYNNSSAKTEKQKCIKFQPIKKSTIQPREIDQVGVELMEERRDINIQPQNLKAAVIRRSN